MNGGETPKFVEIVDTGGKAYESAKQEVPQLVLSEGAEKQLKKLLVSQKALDKFKELLEEETEQIEDAHEAGLFVPNTWMEYNAMHGTAIERRDHFNLVFENLMGELERHGERPKEGDTPQSIKQRVIDNLGLELDLASKEIQQEIKEAKTKAVREKKRREYKREAGIDIR